MLFFKQSEFLVILLISGHTHIISLHKTLILFISFPLHPLSHSLLNILCYVWYICLNMCVCFCIVLFWVCIFFFWPRPQFPDQGFNPSQDSESSESWPLDHQGAPECVYFIYIWASLYCRSHFFQLILHYIVYT